jgi:hypothetical protein
MIPHEAFDLSILDGGDGVGSHFGNDIRLRRLFVLARRRHLLLSTHSVAFLALEKRDGCVATAIAVILKGSRVFLRDGPAVAPLIEDVYRGGGWRCARMGGSFGGIYENFCDAGFLRPSCWHIGANDGCIRKGDEWQWSIPISEGSLRSGVVAVSYQIEANLPGSFMLPSCGRSAIRWSCEQSACQVSSCNFPGVAL